MACCATVLSMFPISSSLSSSLLAFHPILSDPLSSSSEPLPPFPLPSLPPGFLCRTFCKPEFNIAAPAAAPAKEPGVLAFSNPKKLRINFSAGIINPIATKEYTTFVDANSYADVTSIVYNNKCNGCNNKLNMYSFNHLLNPCACPSLILSIGYVKATNGAIIVRKAIYSTLLKYTYVKYIVNSTNIT